MKHFNAQLGALALAAGLVTAAPQVTKTTTSLTISIVSLGATPSSTALENVWSKVSPGISTECKTCPYESCTNKAAYNAMQMFRATCWTTGTRIGETNLWLKSEDGCYVTVKDTLKYARDYTNDIKYCGKIKEEVTTKPATVLTSVDCRRCPHAKCEAVTTYPQRVNVNLNCKAQALPDCLGTCNAHWATYGAPSFDWVRTSDGCYVQYQSVGSGASRSSDSKVGLPDCGPVPFLTSGFRAPPPPKVRNITMTETATATEIITSVTTLSTTLSTTVSTTLSTTLSTTIIDRPPPCESCPPLIWSHVNPGGPMIPASTSPGVKVAPSRTKEWKDVFASELESLMRTKTSTSSATLMTRPSPSDPVLQTDTTPIIIIPTTSWETILWPTSEPVITISPTWVTNQTTLTGTDAPGITLTPTNAPGITLTPTNAPPGITLTGTTIPGITLQPGITLGGNGGEPASPSVPPTSSQPTLIIPTTTTNIIIGPQPTTIIPIIPTTSTIGTLTPTSVPIITLTGTQEPGITFTLWPTTILPTLIIPTSLSTVPTTSSQPTLIIPTSSEPTLVIPTTSSQPTVIEPTTVTNTVIIPTTTTNTVIVPTTTTAIIIVPTSSSVVTLTPTNITPIIISPTFTSIITLTGSPVTTPLTIVPTLVGNEPLVIVNTMTRGPEKRSGAKLRQDMRARRAVGETT